MPLLTFAEYLATQRPVADLYRVHVEFPVEDSNGSRVPGVLFGNVEDAYAGYLFAPSPDHDGYSVQIGNWGDSGTLEQCAASLYAYYVSENDGLKDPAIAAQMPPSPYLDLLRR